MMQKRIASRADDTVYRILLVRSQRDRRVHLGEFQVTAVIDRYSCLIEYRIVFRFQRFSAFGIGINPVLEIFLYFVLLFTGCNGFRLIEYPLRPPVRILNRVVDLRCFLIHTIFKQPERICPFRSVDLIGFHITASRGISLLIDLPRAVVLVIKNLYAILHPIR